MLQRRRRKKGKALYSQKNIEQDTYSSTHPSTTFINNLLHSKSTYFYNGWVNKNSDVYSSKRFSQQHSVKLSKSNPTGRDFDPLQPGYNALWKKRNWSYLLPTFCILALLVGLFIAVNPDSTLVYAKETDNVITSGSIEPYAITPTLSLTIGGAGADETVNAYTGTVAYRAHSVTIDVNQVKSYTLALTGPAKLVNGATELTGAGNKTPDVMSDNTWGYYYGDNPQQTGVAYQSLTGETQTLEAKSNITSGSTTNTKNLIFAAKFGDDALAGHYTGNITLSLVAEAIEVVKYSITYNANGDNVTNMPTPNPYSISDESGGSSITTTLSSTIPTRTGYTFKGWSTSSTATTAQYQPNSTITLQEANKDITLYAVWELPFGGITNMQQMTSSICAATPEGASKILTDIRDNKKYWVTKLKDGNCWMTQNLAYNGGGTSRGANCSGWVNTSTVAQYCTPEHSDGNHASRGNYYSWPAAMNGNTSATGQVQGVCPNGWHLPTSNTTVKGSFGGLAAAYGAGNNTAGSAIMRGAPMYFQLSGLTDDRGAFRVDTYGYYWSSTPNGSTKAYYLFLDNGSASPSDIDVRYYGSSVRCLAN